ncbi:hypothetical protein PV08_08772 [Exophiala spinifera]|uniref:Uncharacterized protein n=1 Tax=Exophiala spinifera TaxID=91928 RepID=A0A0D2B3V6_9EURO|nr:uncharacterized protein PV08_08772 [Exophiala spinifera]KIW13583.1 hypothetical protein PV08_08772 [Exophiala spinifera]
MNPLIALRHITRLATFLVALVSIAAGVRSILKPVDFATSFGFPPSRSSGWSHTSIETLEPSEEKGNVYLDQQPSHEPAYCETTTTATSHDTDPFIPVVGVRNIALGLSILVFAGLNEAHATGILLLCNLVSMAGDTILCRRKGKRGSEMSHLVATLLFAWLGGYNILQ